MSGAVKGMKSSALLKKDGWLVTRGARAGQREAPEAVQEDAHDHRRLQLQRERHKYTQLSGPDRDHSQNTLLLLHPSLPWVSLTPFFPRTHPRGAGRGGEGGSVLSMWPVENHYSALCTKEQQSTSRFLNAPGCLLLNAVWSESKIMFGIYNDW